MAARLKTRKTGQVLVRTLGGKKASDFSHGNRLVRRSEIRLRLRLRLRLG
jgi:hypothetical protein